MKIVYDEKVNRETKKRQTGTIIEAQSNQIEKRTKALYPVTLLNLPCPQTGLSSAALGSYRLLRPISTPGAHHHHALPPNSLSHLRCPLLHAPLGPITVFATKSSVHLVR